MVASILCIVVGHCRIGFRGPPVEEPKGRKKKLLKVMNIIQCMLANAQIWYCSVDTMYRHYESIYKQFSIQGVRVVSDGMFIKGKNFREKRQNNDVMA